MSSEKPPESNSPRSVTGNADYQWSQFDSEAYFQHYYGEPHADDDLVIQRAVEAMKQAPPIGGELDVVDVGTGPNLIPLFCALPRARRLTAWEYAESNVAWLQAELRRDEMRSQWRHFWDVTLNAYGSEWHLPDDPTSLLQCRCSIRQGSIFDLPERRGMPRQCSSAQNRSLSGRTSSKRRACLRAVREARRRPDRSLSRTFVRL